MTIIGPTVFIVAERHPHVACCGVAAYVKVTEAESGLVWGGLGVTLGNQEAPSDVIWLDPSSVENIRLAPAMQITKLYAMASRARNKHANVTLAASKVSEID